MGWLQRGQFDTNIDGIDVHHFVFVFADFTRYYFPDFDKVWHLCH